MCLLGVFVSLIMVTHVVLFGCVEMVTCCFVMMPRGIHMRLFCHGCSLPFLGNGSPNHYDGAASRRVIHPPQHPATPRPDLFIYSTKGVRPINLRRTNPAIASTPVPCNAKAHSVHRDR